MIAPSVLKQAPQCRFRRPTSVRRRGWIIRRSTAPAGCGRPRCPRRPAIRRPILRYCRRLRAFSSRVDGSSEFPQRSGRRHPRVWSRLRDGSRAAPAIGRQGFLGSGHARNHRCLGNVEFAADHAAHIASRSDMSSVSSDRVHGEAHHDYNPLPSGRLHPPRSETSLNSSDRLAMLLAGYGGLSTLYVKYHALRQSLILHLLMSGCMSERAQSGNAFSLERYRW